MLLVLTQPHLLLLLALTAGSNLAAAAQADDPVAMIKGMSQCQALCAVMASQPKTGCGVRFDCLCDGDGGKAWQGNVSDCFNANNFNFKDANAQQLSKRRCRDKPDAKDVKLTDLCKAYSPDKASDMVEAFKEKYPEVQDVSLRIAFGLKGPEAELSSDGAAAAGGGGARFGMVAAGMLAAVAGYAVAMI
ncbi:uncharacterized protein B0T15DRAFT_534100 [Chaetomium strumarium]|uniref:Extracellular membrane protein CFEM domain-containing protein n=1 Tax=Chaetomium strumarium TaxID=1170767 RepID=A0AAJ0GU62_9PEZI|nr:hypothetical protein B0T15DRAFT_534100 [Chaetomium strumarium]